MQQYRLLQESWRWFGPQDAVTLSHIRQTGATGVVTALHDIPSGEIWPVERIRERKAMIEQAGLQWAVVESVNIHESIKTGSPERDDYIEKYKTTLKNLADCGVHVVCYNFMPVLDWTRTHLNFPVKDGSFALKYDKTALAAFDLFMLNRPEAQKDYSEEEQEAAKRFFEGINKEEQKKLQHTIMAGLPGTEDVLSPGEFMDYLEKYKSIGKKELKNNLSYFLRAIIPYAEEYGINMCIHPDDPPFSILGLPRVVKNEQDLQDILDASPSTNNGITFCTGSLGPNLENDLPGMIERLGDRIHFFHLRNVKRDGKGGFYEADHLDGDVDMGAVMKAVIHVEQKQMASGKPGPIPFRPDHGHHLLFDGNTKFYPGYSGVGRMKGLAELRGLYKGLSMVNNDFK